MYLTSHLLSSFHTDPQMAESWNELHRRWRSTAFGKCITSEHSEARLLSISSRIDYFHFTQRVTSLNLRRNEIGDEGAQHLASALQMNTVRLDLSLSHILPIILISHRHSHRWILNRTTSRMKEHSIWQVHCKWTEWGSISVHLIS